MLLTFENAWTSLLGPLYTNVLTVLPLVDPCVVVTGNVNRFDMTDNGKKTKYINGLK